MPAALQPAPPLAVCAWLNTPGLTLESLRGRIVLVHAFQMHCPGCVELATPQAQRVHDTFAREDVAVVGLHSVFERHEAATPEALERHVREHRYTFPIGIDAPHPGGGLPLTMQAYRLDGTPSCVLIDYAGRLRMKRLGHVTDLALGALLGSLIDEQARWTRARRGPGSSEGDVPGRGQ